MRSGTLKHFAAIEVPVKTKTSTGAVSTVWTLYRSVWVSIEFLNGFEKQSADAAWPGRQPAQHLELPLGVICASIVLGPILLSTLAAISVFTLLEVLGEVVLWRRK